MTKIASTATLVQNAWNAGARSAVEAQKQIKNITNRDYSYSRIFPHFKKIQAEAVRKVIPVPALQPIDKEARMAEFMDEMEGKWKDAFAVVKKVDELAKEVGMEPVQFLDMVRGFMEYANKFGS